MRWNAMPKTKPITHAYRIHMLIAPFAERLFLVNGGHAQNPASIRRMMNLIEQSRADFGAMVGLDRAKLMDCRTREKKMAMLYGSVCFVLHAQQEPDAWMHSVSAETATMTRELVRDADTMLRAYWEQIATFADVLLSANGLRLSAGDVNQWRDTHFQRCDIALSARASADTQMEAQANG
jgi:hypothetical protein